MTTNTIDPRVHRALLAQRLLDLATEMFDTADDMQEYAREQWDGEALDHAHELRRAAGIAQTWADGLHAPLRAPHRNGAQQEEQR
jgi:hypothetical protein